MITETNTIRVWVAGDYADAITAVRDWCSKRGDCYSITRTAFVYSGGMEEGIVATRINYARFPENPQELRMRVEAFAEFLAERLHQKSYTIECPEVTSYHKKEGPWDA